MKYKCVMQLDETDCAAACISTICSVYGIKKSITKIREMAGTDKNGTNGIGVIKALNELGFDAAGVMIEDKKLHDNNISYPCIAHVIKDGMNHYVVIHALEQSQIIIADPADGIVEYEYTDFCDIWTGVLFLVTPTERVFDIKSDKSGGLDLLRILINHKWTIFSIVLTSLLWTLFGIISTLFFRYLVDEFVPAGQVSQLCRFAIGFILINIINGIVQYIRVKLMIMLSKKFDIEITYKSYEHTMLLPMNFFAMRQTGEIISRLNDASKIRDALSGMTISAVVDVIMGVISGIILCVYNVELFGITIVILVLYFAVNLMFVKKIKGANRQILENNSKTNSMFIETIKGVETVKACGAEQIVKEKSKNIFVDLLNSVEKCQDMENKLNTMVTVICKCGYIVILWVGAMMVIRQKITMGTLLAFYSLVGYFLTPVQSVMTLQVQLQGAFVAMERLKQLLESPIEEKNITATRLAEESLGDICINHVSFRYGTRQLILNNVNIQIKKNEKIAIVGESGSGKTTLARLLLGFYEYEAGEILFGQRELHDINKDEIREKIAYVSQEPYFFKGTIRDNLLFGNGNCIEDEQIDRVLEAVKLKEYVDESPEGIMSKIQENAMNLSGGQRQRLNLARALLRKPEVLILDEATSNLDVITEGLITEAVEKISDMTIIVIAHRLCTIRRCDRIIAMKKGSVVESGTHEELLQQKGYYFSLWDEQER